jgi:hypothetical protein
MSSSSSITEKRYLEITPKSFTTDGTNTGILTISSTYLFKVGMLVSIISSTQPILKVKIQRVISDTQLIVIDIGEAVTTKKKLDVSMYHVVDTATIQFLEDKRPVIDLLEIQRQVYEEEPTIALRNHSVDWLGRSYTKDNPLPTDNVVPETSLRFDKVSSSVMYLGEGIFGALDSEPKWKIKKIQITGDYVSITNASTDFNQIWNNRASLIYV